MSTNDSGNSKAPIDWRVISIWTGMAAVIIVLFWLLLSYRYWKSTAEEALVTADKRVLSEKKARFEHSTEIAAVILDPLLYRKDSNGQDLQQLSEAMVRNTKAERIIIMDQRGFVVASSDLKFVKTIQDGMVRRGAFAESNSEGYDVLRPIKHEGTQMGWVSMRYKLD